MAQNKHKTKRRIICILCASIIVLYALSIPIGAVVNGSQVSGDSTGLYGISPFSYTVGFVQNDPTLDRNYIFATDVGGYGLLDNTTVEGDDVFEWQYPDASGTNISSILYTGVEENWLEDSLHWYTLGPSGLAEDQNHFYGGIGGMTLEYNNVTGDYDSTAESIVFKARNVYYNTIWSTHQTSLNSFEFYENPTPQQYMMPSFSLPILDNYSTQAFVGAYSVEVYIISPNGTGQWHTYSVPIDTRNSIPTSIPFISYDIIKSYGKPDPSSAYSDHNPKTLLIQEYRGYLDVDYYEYAEPEPSIVGTWTINDSVATVDFDGYVECTGKFTYFVTDNTFAETDLAFIGRSQYPYSSGNLFFLFGLGGRPCVGFQGVNLLKSSSDFAENGFSGVSRNSSNIVVTTFTIDTIDDTAVDYDAVISWLQANATKQGSTATVAEEGTWEKVADSPLLNKVSVYYPMYNTSNATNGMNEYWHTVFDYPSAKKFMDEVMGNASTSPDLPVYDEIPEGMYDDYTSWLGKGVAGFFSAQIFPGISLGGIVGVIVMFGCAIALLKIFAGG